MNETISPESSNAAVDQEAALQQKLAQLLSALSGSQAVIVICFLLFLVGLCLTLFNLRQLHLAGAKPVSKRPVIALALSFFCGWLSSVFSLVMHFHDFSDPHEAQSCGVLAKLDTMSLVAHLWLVYIFLYYRAKLVTPRHCLGLPGDMLFCGTLCSAGGIIILTVLVDGRVLKLDSDTAGSNSICLVESRPWLSGLFFACSVLVGLGYIFLFAKPVSQGYFEKFPPSVDDDDAASPLLAGLQEVAKRNLKCTVAISLVSFTGYTFAVAVTSMSQDDDDADRLLVVSAAVKLVTMVTMSYVGRLMRGIAVPDTAHHISLQVARCARLKSAPPRPDLGGEIVVCVGQNSSTTVVPSGARSPAPPRKKQQLGLGYVGNSSTVSKMTVLNFEDPEAASRRRSAFRSDAHEQLRTSFVEGAAREEEDGQDEEQPAMSAHVEVCDEGSVPVEVKHSDGRKSRTPSSLSASSNSGGGGGHSKQKSTVVVEAFLREEYTKDAQAEAQVTDQDAQLLVFNDDDDGGSGVDAVNATSDAKGADEGAIASQSFSV
jgi:hypothetical protein